MLSRLAASGLLLPTALAAVGLAILLGLGTWQLERRAWKEGILARIKERQSSAPANGSASWPNLPCATATDAAPRGGPGHPCEYQPVVLRGVFDHAAERHIFTATPKAPGLPASTPGGYWVFTPLKLEFGTTAYINRGFVPEPLKNPTSRIAGLVQGPVEITGLYRTAQARATFDGVADIDRNIWYVRNPAELWGGGHAAAGPATMSAYLDMTGPSPPGGWPRPLAGKVELSNRHLEYALTWYGLAATLIGVYGAFAWGRLRGRAAS